VQKEGSRLWPRLSTLAWRTARRSDRDSSPAARTCNWTISNIQEHYDYNAATMLEPKNEKYNFDFSFRSNPHLFWSHLI